MKCKDLISWSRINLQVDKAFSGCENIGCVWAPEMIYDEYRDRIMLYFTLRFKHGLMKATNFLSPWSIIYLTQKDAENLTEYWNDKQ